MKSVTVKIYRIGDSDEYKGIRQLGFNKCKQCGEGLKGVLTALGLGYLEEMALRQSYLFNNLIFFQGLGQKFDDLDLVDEVVGKIEEGTADQVKIVALAKSSEKFLQQVRVFARRVFDVEDLMDEGSCLEVLNCDRFRSALRRVNVQIGIYNYFGIIDEIVWNRAAYPVRINLLIQDWEGQVMNLYHEDYLEIKVENFNTSERFVPECYGDGIAALEDLALMLIEKVPSPKVQLSVEFEELKGYSLSNFIDNL